MTETVKKTMDFAYGILMSGQSCKNTSQEQMLYRWEHTLRVAAFGQQIARNEGIDEEAMIVGCLLHDISYCSYSSNIDWREHGWMSADMARPFVATLNFDGDTQKDILFGIAAHVTDEANFDWKSSVLSQSIGDCDNIDRFDAFRIYDTMHGESFRDKLIEEQRSTVKTRLHRLEKLLTLQLATPTATELWRDRVAFQIEFYTRLNEQLSKGLD